ncbi:hypothetical protein [Erythrobacter sp. WG]|uniref:hypothetical protein n=1 Tax=Erythrobacter sp. WG TaxID=2985510 RepID=UPI00226F2F9A|nr:hypothetical protein [Erythrobacter sp. WG]MCX9147848.1 hypothetical protein [Erythrobacter sp. WG]
MIERTAVPRPLAQRVAIILAVVVQIGAGFLPRIGIGTFIGDRSDAVRTLITPAGWAFAIWGPLFVLSVLFAMWQALPRQKDNPLLARIGWPAAVALAAQGVWSTYTQLANLTAISVAIILVSLACLLFVCETLARARTLTPGERLFVVPAFTGLAAWLTAASIVNVAASLRYHGLAGPDPAPLVAAAMVAIGALIAAVAVARLRGVPLYGLVFCWALVAINAAGGRQAEAVGIAAIAGIVLVLAVTVWRLSQPGNRRHWLGGGQARPTLT